MITPLLYVRRLRHTLAYYAGGLYREINRKDVFLWAQAIAFKVLITIVPVVILATGIFGQMLKGRILPLLGIDTPERPFLTIARFIREFLPAYQSDQLISFLDQLQSASNTFTIIGIAGLVFSAMTLFTTLRVVISNVFQEDWHESRSILGGYLFDLRMSAQVGLLFLLTIGLSLVVQAFNAAGAEWLAAHGLDFAWVRTGWRHFFTWAVMLLPYLITTLMFFQLFYFIPKPRPPRRSALLGAGITALLWEIAKFGFTFYAAYVGRFERYGGPPSDDGLAVLGNTFGLIIAFVLWVYFSGIVLVLGALIVLLHEKNYRSRDAAPAERVPAEETPDRAETAPPTGPPDAARATDPAPVESSVSSS
ncbi:hypothetical protein AWN76_007855 [Rhodothermaceae bacterium RA]|nr:hypothetical protein AWN76_007855 [Rhodothermaceae bacterium RA]